MAVGRYDDDMRDNPKLVRAGDRAAWLWWCGVQYCRSALTDGFIPRVQVASLFAGAVNPRNSAAALVREHLWIEVDGGYQVHDYLDWNPSKAEVITTRNNERDRKRQWRGVSQPVSQRDRDGTVPPESQAVSEHRTRAGALSAPLRSARSGSGASDEDPAPSRARGECIDASGAWRQPARHTPLVTTHLRCDVLAASACARGICVPAFLVAQWRQQGGDDVPAAEAAIRVFVTATVDALAPGWVGDDPMKFWRAAWTAQHGSQAPRETRESRILEAGARTRAAIQRGEL